MASPAAASAPPAQLQVRFITRHPDISVPTAPILVPSNLKRLGLSQIVNHLLDPATPVPFDFLVNGAFLRSSLNAYLTQNGLSSESVITLEYVRAIVPPKYQASFQHDDWVSSVSTVTLGGDHSRILSGSYDGIARVWNLSGQVLAEASGHGFPIKAVKWLDGGSKIVTSSIDRSIRLWDYQDEPSLGTGTITSTAELVGHRASVDSIAVDSNSHRILSASSDGTVGFWSTLPNESPAAPEDLLPPKTKKRKTSSPNTPAYGALKLLEGHTGPVSDAAFDPKTATVAYSVSWDHTIRTWDLPTCILVDTRTTQHPILSICALPSLSLLACGSSARHITLHDPRASASTIATSTLRGHTNAVVSLSANRDSEWQMVSAGHDGTVRVWDVRATGSGSMFTIKREAGEGITGKEKVFDVEWSTAGIVSGGEDKRVQINETPKGVEGELSAVKEKL